MRFSGITENFNDEVVDDTFDLYVDPDDEVLELPDDDDLELPDEEVLDDDFELLGTFWRELKLSC